MNTKLCLKENTVWVTFMGQAGFIFETCDGIRIGVDLYLSDCCERYFGFKRLMPYVAEACELDLDFLLCTHAHFDHFDPDSVPVILSNPKTRLIAACDVKKEAKRLGLKKEKITYVKVGDTVSAGDVVIEAIPCDHGKDTPDAIGLLIKIGDKRIIIAGDTCFHPEYFTSEKVKDADLLVLPINGAYGNLNEQEAAKSVTLANPKLAIPCHYWNFAEHGGNPQLFVEALKNEESDIPYMLMRPAETIVL